MDNTEKVIALLTRAQMPQCSAYEMLQIINRVKEIIESEPEHEPKAYSEEWWTFVNSYLKGHKAEIDRLTSIIAKYKACNGSYDLTMLAQALHDEKCKEEFTDYSI